MSEATHAIEPTHEAHGGAAPPGDADGASVQAGAGQDSHGHGEALGAFDWRAWGAGLLGIAAGLAVAACFWLSANL